MAVFLGHLLLSTMGKVLLRKVRDCVVFYFAISLVLPIA
jgi:hypothetical protein